MIAELQLTGTRIAEMFLNEKTVKNYVSNLRGKLGMTHHRTGRVVRRPPRRASHPPPET